MQEKKLTRAKIVIEALRKHYGLSVGGFAEMLGVGGSTVSTWASRDSLDEDLVFRKCEGVCYDFLTTGKGAMFDRDLREVSEGGSEYPPEILAILEFVKNAPIAKAAILELAKLPEDQHYEYYKSIKDKVLEESKKGGKDTAPKSQRLD